jgi:hypothetical protein
MRFQAISPILEKWLNGYQASEHRVDQLFTKAQRGKDQHLQLSLYKFELLFSNTLEFHNNHQHLHLLPRL